MFRTESMQGIKINLEGCEKGIENVFVAVKERSMKK